MKEFNPKIIPELYNSCAYIENQNISELINKYKYPVIDSDDVLIYCHMDFIEIKIFVLKTIVNGQLVTCFKEINVNSIESTEFKKNNCKFFINEIEFIEPENTNAVNLSNEYDEYKYGLDMLIDISKKTWTNKNIIIYNESDAKISGTKYKKNKTQINFNILSFISESNDIIILL
jgi:formyltetrahydrofolate hydrolase